MLTEKDYCDYETCVALEEVGFPLHPYGNTEIDTSLRLTVLLYEAQKWLREEKNIDVLIELETKDIHLSSKYYSIYISYMSRFRREFSCMSKNFDSYEEALSEGVRASIKILQDEQKENN